MRSEKERRLSSLPVTPGGEKKRVSKPVNALKASGSVGLQARNRRNGAAAAGEVSGAKVASVPQRLKKPIEEIERTVDASQSVLLASSKEQILQQSRTSIASLYRLAAQLHSRQLPYASKSIDMSSSKQISSEQIWGQLSLLLRPVIRRLGTNVRASQKAFGNMSNLPTHKGSGAGKRALKGAGAAPFPSSETDAEKSDDDLSSMAESELDEEIARLLAEKQHKAKGSGSTRGNDDWRYAFGRGNEEDDDDDDDGSEMEGDVGELNELLRSGKSSEKSKTDTRIRDRNARVMAEMMDEDGAESNGNEDAAEELAALKEMYGEDFEMDDMEGGGLEDSEADGDIDEMLSEEAEDAAASGGAAATSKRPRMDGGAPEELDFAEFDRKYWGKDDILDDQSEVFGENNAERVAPVADCSDADEVEGLTDLQRERRREAKAIQQMEEERILGGKQWAMGGEVGARKRPMDSLLEEHLDFEHGMKAVPVITEQTTANLEERIKQRVLSKNFNDVQRRLKLTTPDALIATKRDAALDSQKSKMSLMDLYEKEYLDKVKRAEEAAGVDAPSAEPLTEVEKDELRAVQMWKRLAQHLDALSNFHFTPNPVQMELEARVRAVENQAPAITIEAAGHFATTRETALAPQDLFRADKRSLTDVGTDEMDPRERRAKRRAMKAYSSKAKEVKQKRAEVSKKRQDEKLRRKNEEKALSAAASKKGRGKK